MSDSLQPGVKVVPTFVDGEAPPAAKFNSIGAQLMRATRKLELVFGDAHDESYPYSSLSPERLSIAWGRSKTTDAALTGTATRELNIASIARLIGPSSNLNPKLPPGTVTVVEDVPAGVYEFTLQFPPLAVTASTDSAVVIANVQVSPTTVNSAGDFYRDGSTIYTFIPTAGDQITYTLTPSTWGSGPNYTGATFNVIPDLNQLEAGGLGCNVSGGVDAEGRHTVTLPLCTHLASDITGAQIALTNQDPLYSEQLLLPRVLTENYSSLEVIPAGFLFLKNWTTGEVYDDAVYYYSTSSVILIGGVDLADEVTAGDLFCIFTVGTDITTTIDDLRQKMAYHTHDRSRGEAAVEAESLVGWTKEAGGSGQFIKSEIPGNYAPQYLHRDGYDSGGTTDEGMNDENIMRGDLGLGAEGASAGGYTDTGTPADSYALRFFGGDGTGGTAGYMRLTSSGNIDIVAQNFIKPSTPLVPKLHNDTAVIADAPETNVTVRPFYLKMSSYAYATTNVVVTLGTWGFSTENILTMQILAKETADDIWFPANWTEGAATDYSYYWGVYDQSSGTPWQLAIVLNGVDWSASGDLDIIISGLYVV